jgi:heat shock protein HslJ
MKNLFLSLIILMTLSCSKTDDLSPDQNKMTLAQINSIAGEYIFEGYAVSKTPGSSEVTLTIKKNSNEEWNFRGRSYVNEYGGTYRFDQTAGSIVFKELTTTLIAAVDNSRNLAEQEYYGNFPKIRKFKLEGSTLKLFDSEPASEIMIFKKK